MSVIDSALAQIKQLHPYTPGKPVEELERELGISNAIKLAANENPLGCSPLAKAALGAESQKIEFYPDANAFYLKQKLAQKLGVQSDQITIGNGSNDVLDLLGRCFLDANAEAIYSQYAFLVYALVTQACGATARVAEAITPGNEQAYGHNLAAMLELINDKTRIIFIANPNNPTGNWLPSAELSAFIEQVPEHIAIVIDEAYFEYVEEQDYAGALQWLAQYSNLIVTRTFSKIYGLAGLRIGYSVSSPEICDLLNRVRQPFNGNAMALAAATASLDDNDFLIASRNNNQKGLKQLQDYFSLKKMVFIPSACNFLTVNFGAKANAVNEGLLQQGIIVRPVANYDMPEFLRISVGTEAQHQRLFKSLDELL